MGEAMTAFFEAAKAKLDMLRAIEAIIDHGHFDDDGRIAICVYHEGKIMKVTYQEMPNE